VLRFIGCPIRSHRDVMGSNFARTVWRVYSIPRKCFWNWDFVLIWFLIWSQKIIGCTWTLDMTKKLGHIKNKYGPKTQKIIPNTSKIPFFHGLHPNHMSHFKWLILYDWNWLTFYVEKIFEGPGSSFNIFFRGSSFITIEYSIVIKNKKPASP